MKTILFIFLVFIGIPTIIAFALWTGGIGIIIHGLIVGFLYMFFSGTISLLLGTLLYWLIFFGVTCLLFTTNIAKKKQ